MGNELERASKEPVATHFIVLFRHLPGGSEENQRNVFKMVFEPRELF
jgi:hypothetical protein